MPVINWLQKLPMGNNMLSGVGRWVGQFAIGPTSMVVRALAAPVAFGVQALLVDREGRVGVVRHSYMRGWSLPGGGVGRGEPAPRAVMREMAEELGTLCCDPPVFFGLYTRRAGWVTNVVAVYRLMNAEVDFRPNLEVRELRFVDPSSPPEGTMQGTLRRLAEYSGKAPQSPYW